MFVANERLTRNVKGGEKTSVNYFRNHVGTISNGDVFDGILLIRNSISEQETGENTSSENSGADCRVIIIAIIIII